MKNKACDNNSRIDYVDQLYEVCETVSEKLYHDLSYEEQQQEVIDHIKDIPACGMLWPNKIADSQLCENHNH
jgi:hypothetical protein